MSPEENFESYGQPAKSIYEMLGASGLEIYLQTNLKTHFEITVDHDFFMRVIHDLGPVFAYDNTANRALYDGEVTLNYNHGTVKVKSQRMAMPVKPITAFSSWHL